MTPMSRATCQPATSEINNRTENKRDQQQVWFTMTRLYCPVGTCDWYHDQPEPEPPGLIPLQRIPGAALKALQEHHLTAEQILDGHLTGRHTRIELVEEILAERARADAATANYNSLYGALKMASDFTRQMDALTIQRMPSRAEVHAVRAALADAGAVGADA